MKLRITRTLALFPLGFHVQWDLEDARESGVYRFTLERSGSPEGPWDPVVVGVADQYAVSDEFAREPNDLVERGPNQLSFTSSVHYRVTCVTPSGARLTDTQETAPANPSPKMAQYLRKAQRDFTAAMKPCFARSLALLKRRTWGVRCPKCSDPRTGQIMRSDCKSCWGTGVEGGYWAPHYTTGKRSAPDNQTNIRPDQKGDTNAHRFVLPSTPSLERDDVIVSIESGQRYRVEKQNEPQIQLRAVRQSVDVVELARDHIIYRFRVEPDARNPRF